MHLSPQELMRWDEPTETKTIVAHFNGDEYTEEELDKIKEFAKFVKLQRKWLFNQIRTAFYIIRGIVQNCSN